MANYATYTEAIAYAATVYPAPTNFTSAIAATQTRALAEATRIIDQLSFKGEKTDSSQTNEFPRDDETTVPTSIKNACCEIAFSLLDGVDPQEEYNNLFVTSHAFGDAKISFDRSNMPANILAGVPSVKAWRMLIPYINDPRTLVMERVS